LAHHPRSAYATTPTVSTYADHYGKPTCTRGTSCLSKFPHRRTPLSTNFIYQRTPARPAPHTPSPTHSPPSTHPNSGSASPTLFSCTSGHNMGCTAVGRTRLPSKEPFPPHTTVHTADRT
jgi:hypothetical protein